jgi:hypothetical protein
LYFRNPSPHRGDEETPVQDQEVSFSIKRALGARKGWKIIADDGHSIDGSALRTVVSMIKDMECQVPKIINKRTFKLKIFLRVLQSLRESVSEYSE